SGDDPADDRLDDGELAGEQAAGDLDPGALDDVRAPRHGLEVDLGDAAGGRGAGAAAGGGGLRGRVGDLATPHGLSTAPGAFFGLRRLRLVAGARRSG